VSESAELEQLRELIELFPANFALDEVEEANKLARTRFDAMDNELVPLISTMALNTAKFGVKNYIKYCRIFHSIIFKYIISINDEFRSSGHDGSGSVYFDG